FTLTFRNGRANANLPQIAVDGTLLTGGGTVASATVVEGMGNETQTITMNGTPIVDGTGNEVQTFGFTGTVTAGTITFTFNGQSTAAITITTATAGVIQTALEGLSTIGVGNVSVTGPQLNTAAPTMLITFRGALANTNVAQITAVTAGLAGGVLVAPSTVSDGGGTSAGQQ